MDPISHHVPGTGNVASIAATGVRCLNKPTIVTIKDEIKSNLTAGAGNEKVLNNNNNNNNEIEYRLSGRRWLILIAISTSGLLTAASGQYESILEVMLKLLDLPINKYLYIQQTFMYLPAISSMPTAWFIDKYGLKISMYVATLLGVIRYAFRLLLFMPNLGGWHDYKYVYWIVSGFLNTQFIAIFMCLPLKVSENWFPKSERSLAWTLMISSLDIGTAIASFLYPRLVTSIDSVEPLAYFNMISLIVTAILVPSFIARSNPKYPPSQRMQMKRQSTNYDNSNNNNNNDNYNYNAPTMKTETKDTKEENQDQRPVVSWLGAIKQLLKHRQMMLHLISRCVFASMALTVTSFMQDILLSSGHSTIFCGNLLALNSSMSVIMLIALSSIVHRVQNITLACKLTTLLESLFYTCHMLLILYSSINESLIIIVTVIFIALKCLKQPYATELTGQLLIGNSISEATISAVGITLFTSLTTINQILLVELKQIRPDGRSDYTLSIKAASIICLLNSVIYFIFFEGHNITTNLKPKLEPNNKNQESVKAEQQQQQQQQQQAIEMMKVNEKL